MKSVLLPRLAVGEKGEIWIIGRHYYNARAFMISKLISLGSVACNSTWMPSSSLLNLSLELAYTIFSLTFDVSGALNMRNKKIKINIWYQSMQTVILRSFQIRQCHAIHRGGKSSGGAWKILLEGTK